MTANPIVDAAAPTIERVAASRRDALDLATTAFGSVMSDHMLVAEYADGAWRDVAIRPYGPLSLLPSISGLNYAVSVLEGLKAHRGPGDEILIFRPRDNARRMIRSAERLVMAPVPEQLFLDWLEQLLEVDQRWVPDASTGALYIRPLLFSTDPQVRPQPASRFMFVIYSSPYAAYYSAPLDVHVVERYVRAFRGGTGDVKPGGNYAQALIGDREAARSGCQTALWLDGVHREYIEECGVMNVFFVLGDTVVTPELSGTILAGVQRDSVITLLRDRGIRVDERRISINELVSAHQRGELREAFGTGTAATVSHVRSIRWRDHHLVLPLVEQRTIGPEIRAALLAIATGRAPDPHGWVTRVGRGSGELRS
jgi:branched-chain amino acid aminotransferase